MSPVDLLRYLLKQVLKWREENPKKAVFLMAYIIYKFLNYMTTKPINMRTKVILITGGASGIGRRVALGCKKMNATVCVWDINENGLRDMENQVDFVKRCNVAIKDEVNAAAVEIVNKYGRVDILVNNAGIISGKSLLELSEAQIRRTFDVNVIAHFWTCQAFLPLMIRQNWGQIVTIASTAGRTGIAGMSDYCASKFAARGFEESLRDEMKVDDIKGIGFTCINPYFIDTGMFDGAKLTSDIFLRNVFYLLDPDYVAYEIIEAIRYRKREITLPKILGWFVYAEHFMPLCLKDYLKTHASDMTNFRGH